MGVYARKGTHRSRFWERGLWGRVQRASMATGLWLGPAADRIVGAHFFSPAHVMPLLEIVRTDRTSKQVRRSPAVLLCLHAPLPTDPCAAHVREELHTPASCRPASRA